MAKKSHDPRTCFELGCRIEYLAGIATHQIIPWTGLSEFPALAANQPGLRFEVPRVVEMLQGLLSDLESLKLAAALEAAEPFRPMLKEMEDFLNADPKPTDTTLNDHFADKLVQIAGKVGEAIRKDLGG